MRVLLDHCVAYRAKRLLAGHQVSHTSDLGWEEIQNGALIAAAASAGFDVFFTVDKKIRHEHRLGALPLPVVEVNTHFVRLPDLRSVAHRFDAAIAAMASFRFVSIAADGTLELLAPRPAT